MIRKAAALVVLALIATGCSKQEPADPAAAPRPNPQQSYEAALAIAEQARDRAREVRNEWISAQRFMNEASAYAETGDYEEATRMLALAREQYDLAVEQAEYEATAWQARVLR